MKTEDMNGRPVLQRFLAVLGYLERGLKETMVDLGLLTEANDEYHLSQKRFPEMKEGLYDLWLSETFLGDVDDLRLWESFLGTQRGG